MYLKKYKKLFLTLLKITAIMVKISKIAENLIKIVPTCFKYLYSYYNYFDLFLHLNFQIVFI